MKKQALKIQALSVLLVGVLMGCSGSGETKTESTATATNTVKYDKVDGVAVDMNNKGVGPVTSVTISDEIDQAMVAEGKEIFDTNCFACHKADTKFIGPAPKGVLDRRAPEWVMNMILDPMKMTAEDPIAKQLLIEYNGSPMANQGITEPQARAILEYFRTL